MTLTPERLAELRALAEEPLRTENDQEILELIDLLAEKDAKLAEHGRTWRWVGPCDGCTYVEPEESCPMHGRELTDWRDIADEVIGRQNEVEADRDAALAERDAALVKVAAVEALADDWGDINEDRALMRAFVSNIRAALATGGDS